MNSKNQTKQLNNSRLAPVVVNIGLEWFHKSFKSQKVKCLNVDFKPPGRGEKNLIDALLSLDNEEVNKANAIAVDKILNSQPVLVDVLPAKKVVPGIKPDPDKYILLHSGPPIEYEKMAGPVKGALLGAILYEGWEKTLPRAEKLARSGKVIFEPCHHHSAVGPMAGVLSPSMPVFVVQNKTYGNYAYCSLNEGLGKVLRFGANSPEIMKRLKWMEKILAPVLQKAVRLCVKKTKQGLNIKTLTAQALSMGDECHNRNIAGTGLFLKEILPYLMQTHFPKKILQGVIKFISGNPHFFLNLSMAACKSTADTIIGIKNSTIVSAMARNGVETGIRVAGLGNEWFTAPSGIPKGLYFPGFSEKDANPDLGDSTISEVVGIGAFAMACAPAIVKFVGGKAEDAITYTKQMYEICFSRHKDYLIPAFDFAGTPVGIDIRKVVETGITPFINTGIAHKEPGVGQVGAGILYAPLEPFEKAIKKWRRF